MSVRQARMRLADSRALEEEAERYNPVNPKHQLGSRKGRTSLVADGSEYTGGGATPSMGLSQYRGGSNYAKWSGGDDGEDLVGCGTGAGATGAGRKRKGHSEAHEMGRHLGHHLHSLHGGGFFDDFASGFMSVVKPVANIASTAMKFAPLLGLGATGAGATGAGATGAGKKRRGKGKLVIHHGGAMLGQDGHGTRQVGAGTGAGATGAGFLSDLGIPVISQLAGAIGLGKKGRKKRGKGTGAGNVSGPGYEAVSGSGTGAGDMYGCGDEELEGGGFLSDLGIPIISNLAGAIGLGHGSGATGAGTGAGRSKRAEVVKRVMRDRGVSMIEASKIVKAEGLY